MKKMLYLLMLISSQAMFAQESADYNKIFLDPNSPHFKAQVDLVKNLRDTIDKKLQSLAKKHTQLAFLSPELKEKQLIITEDSPYAYDKGYESDILKYISFDFSGENVKIVTIGSKIKRIHYDLGFENKLITYDPANYEGSSVRMELFDKNQTIPFKDLSLDSQIHSLRLILSYINLAFYKVEMMIVTKKEKRELESLRLLDI